MHEFKNFMSIERLAVAPLLKSCSGRRRRLFLILVMVALPFLSSIAEAEFALYFESSEQSWVGHGLTLLALPEDGYSFLALRNYHDGVDFRIENSSDDHLSLNLAAPYRVTLVPGFYDNAARFPFQELDQPGLTFSGNHRGNNRNSGYFTVLEAVYGADGAVESFAVDFTQYGEENPLWWINGQIRYNSDVPFIPEPATILLLGSGGLALFKKRRA